MGSTRFLKLTASVTVSVAVLASLLLVATGSPARADEGPGVVVANFTGGGINSPSMITAGADGNLWFTNTGGSSIGRITPTGTITRFNDPSISRPYAITVGADGNVWFGNNGGVYADRYTVAAMAPDGSVPIVMTTYYTAINAIAPGTDHDLWYTTDPQPRFGDTYVGRISGGIDRRRASNLPKGIVAGPDGGIWYTNAGDNSIRRENTLWQMSVYTAPGISNPSGIATGPDGNLWFTNRGNNSIGRITPAGVVTIFTDPTIDDPHEITAGPDGNLWFTNTGGNSIGRITPTGIVTAYTGAGISAPLGITIGADGNVWFTNPGNNSIGRLSIGLPSAPVWAHANRGDGSATVTWWPSVDNGSPLTGYVVTPYVEGVAQPPLTFGPATTRAVVPGLANGTTYTFTVTATNVFGTGPPSRATAPITVGTPAVPIWVHASRGDGRATVFWWPMGDNGSPISGYLITPYVDGVAQPQLGTGPDATSAVLTGLTNGTTYTFTVTPFNGFGAGNTSWPSNPVPVGTPGAPIWAHAQPAAGSAVVTWWRVTANGAPITGYVITPFVDGVAQAPRTFGPGSTSRLVTGLTNGTTYTFTVTATNANGTGATSRPTAPIVVGAPS